MRSSIFVVVLASLTGLGAFILCAEPALGTAPPAPALTGRTSFQWPLAGEHHVSRPFLPPADPFGTGHRGVDLTGWPRQPVLAAGDGLVVFAGPLAGRAVISIEHPGGLRTTYEPVSPAVAAGDQVVRGQQIGTVEPGHPECAAPAPQVCLHWGAHRHREYLDPLRLLGLGHVRLLPWDAPPS